MAVGIIAATATRMMISKSHSGHDAFSFERQRRQFRESFEQARFERWQYY
jgi:hypothetical protein